MKVLLTVVEPFKEICTKVFLIITVRERMVKDVLMYSGKSSAGLMLLEVLGCIIHNQYTVRFYNLNLFLLPRPKSYVVVFIFF